MAKRAKNGENRLATDIVNAHLGNATWENSWVLRSPPEPRALRANDVSHSSLYQEDTGSMSNGRSKGKGRRWTGCWNSAEARLPLERVANGQSTRDRQGAIDQEG